MPASQPDTAPSAESAELEPGHDGGRTSADDLAASHEARGRLEKELALRNQELTALEEANASLELELASALDELLRSQSNLRNVTSRAVAVSRIAEVRVQLQTFRGRGDRALRDRLDRSDAFLARADKALNEGNVGGAAYLAERAGELVRQVETIAEIRGRESTNLIPIVPARALEVGPRSRANLRRGPGTSHAIIGTLEPGEVVTAVARQGEWYRIETPAGDAGWIYRSLLTR